MNKPSLTFFTFYELYKENRALADDLIEAAVKAKQLYGLNLPNFIQNFVLLSIYRHPDIEKFTIAIACSPLSTTSEKFFILFINLKFWEKWKDCKEGKAFLLAHEFCHVAFQHLFIDFTGLSETDINIIQDVTIHETIKIPECVLQRSNPATVESVFWANGIPADRYKTCEYYANLYKDNLSKLSKLTQIRKAIIKKIEGEEILIEIIAEIFAEELIKEIDKSPEEKEKLKQQLKEKIKIKIQNTDIPTKIAKRAGLDKALQKFHYSWNNRAIYTIYDWSKIFSKVVGLAIETADYEETWLRPFKKTGIPPGLEIQYKAKVGILFDVSGSMTEVAEDIASVLRSLFAFYREEAEFWVVECDTQVAKGPYKIDKNWKEFSPETGGGTELNLGIEALNKLGPFDIFIFATDGYVFSPLTVKPKTLKLVALYPPDDYKSLKEYYPNIYEIVVKTEKRIEIV